MMNRDEWAKVFEAIEGRANKKAVEALKLVVEEYGIAEKELESQIATWFTRFAKNNKITLAEAKKMLNAKELAELKWDVNQYIAYAKENALTGEWVKELENASAKAHIERLTALKIKNRATIEKLFNEYGNILQTSLKETFDNSYLRTCFEVQKCFGVGWDMSKTNERRLKAALSQPWTADGRDFLQNLWYKKENLARQAEGTLVRGIMTGKAPDKIISEVAKLSGASRKDAGRFVMTETAAINMTAQKGAFEDLGVEEFEFIATLDGTTCAICGGLDGKHLPMKEYKVGVTAPPLHPFCRCCTAPYFEDMRGLGTRAARKKDGTSYEVPDDMTYTEWKKTQEEAAEISDKPLKNNGESGIIDTYKGKPWKVEGNPEISIDTQKAVEEATKKISKDFRSLEKYSEPIIFGDTGDGALAVNRFNGKYGTNRITLSQAAFSNPEKLLQTLEDNYHTGFSYKTQCIESLVAHEMGHNAHMALALQRSNIIYREPFGTVDSIRFTQERKRVSEEIYIAAFTDESYDEIQAMCVSELGKMVDRNPPELIAQSFGNYYYGDKKSRIAKAIVRYFMKELF